MKLKLKVDNTFTNTNGIMLLIMVLILKGNSEIGEQVRSNLLFDLFQAFDWIESSHKWDYFI